MDENSNSGGNKRQIHSDAAVMSSSASVIGKRRIESVKDRMSAFFSPPS